LTLLAVISLAATGAAPLTVIAGGATTGWLVTGVLGIPVAYATIMIPLWLFSVGYTQMSRRIVNPGPFYSYIAQGLARIPGIGAAGVALLGNNAMQIGLYDGFGAVLSGFLASRIGVHIAWRWLAAGACFLIAFLGVRRIAFVSKVLTVQLYALAIERIEVDGHPAAWRPISPLVVLKVPRLSRIVLPYAALNCCDRALPPPGGIGPATILNLVAILLQSFAGRKAGTLDVS
jgi:hypothetical protein